MKSEKYDDEPLDDEGDFEMYESQADYDRAMRVKNARQVVQDLQARAMSRMRAGEKIDADDRKFMEACRVLKEEG